MHRPRWFPHLVSLYVRLIGGDEWVVGGGRDDEKQMFYHLNLEMDAKQ